MLVQLKDDMVKELRTEKQRLLAENSNAEGSRSEKDKSKETLRDRIAKLTMEITDKRLSVDKEYRHKLADQSHLAQALTILSPAVLYDTAACRLARTGINEFDRFMDGAYRLKQGYDGVMIKLMEGRMQQAPEFSYVAEPTAQSYRGVAYSWLFLILMSLIFLSLARTFFIHKDVR